MKEPWRYENDRSKFARMAAELLDHAMAMHPQNADQPRYQIARDLAAIFRRLDEIGDPDELGAMLAVATGITVFGHDAVDRAIMLLLDLNDELIFDYQFGVNGNGYPTGILAAEWAEIEHEFAQYHDSDSLEMHRATWYAAATQVLSLLSRWQGMDPHDLAARLNSMNREIIAFRQQLEREIADL